MMNCTSVMSRMGFECSTLSDKLLRVWSPFTYGSDGEVVGFYVEKTVSGYRVSDGAESLRHAASIGINITKKRMDILRLAAGPTATVGSGGEIYSPAEDSTLTDAISAVLNASLAVSHFESSWLVSEKEKKSDRDEVLKRMLNTPPQPNAPEKKKKPRKK